MSQMVFKKTKEALVLSNAFLHTFPVRRFTVEEYHRMGEVGILDEDEGVDGGQRVLVGGDLNW